MFPIGGHYTYTIQKDGNIIIRPSETGNKISRKFCGKTIKSLIDIRTKEVRDLMSKATSIDVSLKKHYIEVKIYRYQANIQSIGNEQVLIENLFDREQVGTICIDRDFLKKASGDYISHSSISLDDSVSSQFLNKEEIETELKSTFDVVSLFSGAGMWDICFAKDDNFHMVFAIDYDKAACESYRHNIGDILHGDITKLDEHIVPECDVIIGGPSCKAFSAANRQAKRVENHEDVNLVDSYLRIAKEKQPKIFAIENVPSFITAMEGRNLQKVIQAMDGYEIRATIVHDGSLGGYTERKRSIIIGSRIGVVDIPNVKVYPMKTVGDALEKVDESWYNYYDISKSNEETIRKMSLIPQGGNFKDVPELAHLNSHSNRLKRLHVGMLAPSLCNFRKACITHPKYNRILSVSEASALMGMDKFFRFMGNISEKQQQVVNGVTYAIGNFVKNIIKKRLLSPFC